MRIGLVEKYSYRLPLKTKLTVMRNNKPAYTEFSVREETTLLAFVQTALAGISRSRAKAILQGGGCRVRRTVITQHDYPLHPGDRVEISKHKQSATLNSRFVRLVYEDPQIIVVEKAIGILSMASAHHQFCVKTVLDNYLRQSHQRCTAHVVHRLDRDTSGLLVYAKTMEAEQILENNWHNIVQDRRYVALVSGRMEQQDGTVRSWLKDNKQYFTYSSPTDNGGKLAITHFHTLQVGESHSLVELKLETGRKNQIRVHMQDLRHPVCGDVKYGNGDDPIGRLALHAFRLHFYHPITGELLKFETPFPSNFLSVVAPTTKKNPNP